MENRPSLKQFAKIHKLVATLEPEQKAWYVIQGKHGQIFAHNCHFFSAHIYTNWRHARVLLTKAGCLISQNGDDEGVVQFKYNDKKQIDKVFFYVGVVRESNVAPENTTAAGPKDLGLRPRPVRER